MDRHLPCSDLGREDPNFSSLTILVTNTETFFVKLKKFPFISNSQRAFKSWVDIETSIFQKDRLMKFTSYLIKPTRENV